MHSENQQTLNFTIKTEYLLLMENKQKKSYPLTAEHANDKT